MEVNKSIYPDIETLTNSDIVLTKPISEYQNNLDESIFYSSSNGRYSTLSEGVITGARYSTTYVALENAKRNYQTLILTYAPNLLIDKTGSYSHINSHSFKPYIDNDYTNLRLISGFKYYSICAVPYIVYSPISGGTNKSNFTTIDNYFNNLSSDNAIIGVTVRIFIGNNSSRTIEKGSVVNVANYNVPNIVKNDTEYEISDTTQIQNLFPQYNSSGLPYIYNMAGVVNYPYMTYSTDIQGICGYPFMNFNAPFVDRENTLSLWGESFNNQFPKITLTKEDILEMTATLGLIFSPSVDVARLLNLTVDANIENDELYFPIKSGSGLWQGDYTHGKGNKDTEQYKNNWNGDVNAPFTNGSPAIKDVDENEYSDKMVRGSGRQAGVFNNIYAVNENSLKELQKILNVVDSEDAPPEIYKNMKFMGNNPMNCITSINWYPFPIMRGNSTNIIIGSTTTNIPAFECAATATTIDMGFCDIKPIHKDHKFLNFEPYSYYFLYVPFCGWSQLDSRKIYGNNIHLYMNVDYLSGVLQAEVWINNTLEKTIEGVASNPVSVQATDLTSYQNSRFNSVFNAISNIGSITTGNVVGGAVGLSQNLANFLLTQINYNDSKAITAMLSTYLPTSPCILRYSVQNSEPANYKNSVGYACEFSDTISNLSGYTVINNFNTSAITATDAEKQMLKTIAENGFYI